jgi:hypothetical protein
MGFFCPRVGLAAGERHVTRWAAAVLPGRRHDCSEETSRRYPRASLLGLVQVTPSHKPHGRMGGVQGLRQASLEKGQTSRVCGKRQAGYRGTSGALGRVTPIQQKCHADLGRPSRGFGGSEAQFGWKRPDRKESRGSRGVMPIETNASARLARPYAGTLAASRGTGAAPRGTLARLARSCGASLGIEVASRGCQRALFGTERVREGQHVAVTSVTPAAASSGASNKFRFSAGGCRSRDRSSPYTWVSTESRSERCEAPIAREGQHFDGRRAVLRDYGRAREAAQVGLREHGVGPAPCGNTHQGLGGHHTDEVADRPSVEDCQRLNHRCNDGNRAQNLGLAAPHGRWARLGVGGRAGPASAEPRRGIRRPQ